MFDQRTIDNQRTFYIIDGTSFCFRSFYAIQGLTTPDGIPTNAVFGFVNILRKLIHRFNPVFMGICFDVSRKTFRSEKFSAYKIQRPALPDALKIQIGIIKELIGFWGITLCQQEGVEADDLIATLARKAEKEGLFSVAITSDKDILQIVNDHTVVYNPSKEIFFDVHRVQDVLGVVPRYVVDFLALCGDTSDNIPGARGIGPKTATELIQKFGSVEEIFRNIDMIQPERVQNILRQHREMVFLSKELATLRYDLQFSGDIMSGFTIQPKDEPRLYELFLKLGFKQFLAEMKNPVVAHSACAPAQRATDALRDAVLKNRELVFYLDQATVYCVYNGKLVCEDISFFKIIFEDNSIRKISWGLQEGIVFLHNHGIVLRNPYFDVMVASYVLRPDFSEYSLEDISRQYLKQADTLKSEESVFIIEQLYRILDQQIREQSLAFIFFQIEMPLVSVLSWMRVNSIRVDVDFLKKMQKQLAEKIVQLRSRIHKLAQKEFNLNSPQQLAEVLFMDLRLPKLRRTKTGFSTDEETLRKLSTAHPIIALLLEYRKIHKLVSTYLEPFVKQAEGANGFLSPVFSQVSTQTGRLSATSPNVQNIPIRDETGRMVRGAFISQFPEGYIVSADYSQIELRVLAHLSEDKNLVDAFQKDRDIHTFTASLLFSEPEETIDAQKRDFAKRINFGIIYGMTAHGLAKELAISFADAQRFIDEYFVRYPEVRSFLDRTIAQAKEKGYVETLFGRRRYMENMMTVNRALQEALSRQAINAPVQGTAADIIKLAMRDIYQRIEKESSSYKLLMQVHDELVFDVPAHERDQALKTIRSVMEHVVSLKVPLRVTLKAGANWLQAERQDF